MEEREMKKEIKRAAHKLQDILWDEEMEQVLIYNLYHERDYMSIFLAGYIWYGNTIKPVVDYIIKLALSLIGRL